MTKTMKITLASGRVIDLTRNELAELAEIRRQMLMMETLPKGKYTVGELIDALHAKKDISLATGSDSVDEAFRVTSTEYAQGYLTKKEVDEIMSCYVTF